MQPIGQILVTMFADGSVKTQAQVPNEVIARGMLDKAKDDIVKGLTQPQAEQKPTILLARGSIPAPRNGK